MKMLHKHKVNMCVRQKGHPRKCVISLDCALTSPERKSVSAPPNCQAAATTLQTKRHVDA